MHHQLGLLRSVCLRKWFPNKKQTTSAFILMNWFVSVSQNIASRDKTRTLLDILLRCPFKKYRLTNLIWRASLKCTPMSKQDEETIFVAKFRCNSSSFLLLSWGSPLLYFCFVSGFVISGAHLISWLRFLIRYGLFDSPDPDSSSCQVSSIGSSFSILSSKCQPATAAPVTRSSILSFGAGA